jgi:DNA-nicking Smr family endonuclease
VTDECGEVPEDAVAVEIPITGELDLHTFGPRDIPQVVNDYLDACRERGLAEVRLIHGRGQGVQRAVVRRVLASRADVLSCEDARPGQGGWGATLALLDLTTRGGAR